MLTSKENADMKRAEKVFFITQTLLIHSGTRFFLSPVHREVYTMKGRQREEKSIVRDKVVKKSCAVLTALFLSLLIVPLGFEEIFHF